MSLSISSQLLQVPERTFTHKTRLSTSQDRPKKKKKVRKDVYGKTIEKGGKHSISFNPKIYSFIGLPDTQSQHTCQIQKDYYSDSDESEDEIVFEKKAKFQHKKQIESEQQQAVVEHQEIQIDLIMPKDEMGKQDKKSQNKTIVIEQSACCQIF